jgi:hypothetical protein
MHKFCDGTFHSGIVMPIVRQIPTEGVILLVAITVARRAAWSVHIIVVTVK